MSATSTESEEPASAEPVPQTESHLGAVHILHAVVGGVAEYLYDKGDSDGEWLASALLNVDRLVRNTLPAGSLDEQNVAAAFAVIQDAAQHAREPWEWDNGTAGAEDGGGHRRAVALPKEEVPR
ncbi:MAG TPA: hypothetical protein VHI13_05670 [Candidatus Kapabacteria bacterium]|nr:hypothetical protein [Candidatus Kapabacteria bacterium]